MMSGNCLHSLKQGFTGSRFFLVVISIESALAIYAGAASAAHSWPIVLALVLAQVPVLALLIYLCDVSLGGCSMSCRQVCAEAIMSGVPNTAFWCLCPVVYSFPARLQSLIISTAVAASIAFVWTGGQHGSVLVMSIVVALRAVQNTIEDELPKHIAVAAGFAAVLLSSSFCVCMYSRDQCMVFNLTGTVALSIMGGGYMHLRAYFKTALYAAVSISCTYNLLLWRRRRRYFPDALKGAKWIRLSFLRSLVKNGGQIVRQQLLPPQAFGDPSKASHLVVISHRWLHRYTCDMVSAAFPQGMRLVTMLAKLEAHFSTEGLGHGDSFWECWVRSWRSITPGSDVLLFFDFCSIPQEGRSETGETIFRTPDEEAVFRRCLPSMGSLYSMLPVLICEEVPEGMEPYETSGWCFVEKSIATLGNQLSQYSPQHAASSEARARRHSFSKGLNFSAEVFLLTFMQELQAKHFCCFSHLSR